MFITILKALEIEYISHVRRSENNSFDLLSLKVWKDTESKNKKQNCYPKNKNWNCQLVQLLDETILLRANAL